jgi:hypothetical protein
MTGLDFRPGDKVIYSDRDQIQWGPWEVSEVAGETVTVIVEEMITCDAKADFLQKVVAVEELV